MASSSTRMVVGSNTTPFQTDEYREGRKVEGFSPLQRFFVAYAYSWMMAERTISFAFSMASAA